MTVDVSVRSISALLLLCVSLLGLPAGAPAQSVVAPQKAAPTRKERLDRLAAEFDRHRIDVHVPGAVLAIVRGDDVIFARGFGLADIEKKTPVTPETPFFIGSTTKALTATLVGMPVGEGRMLISRKAMRVKPVRWLRTSRSVARSSGALLRTACLSSARYFWTGSSHCMRVPHHDTVSTEMAGRTIFQVRIEVGVELTPDTFTLQASSESGRRK
jgi:hypothetical protein